MELDENVRILWKLDENAHIFRKHAHILCKLDKNVGNACIFNKRPHPVG